MKALLILAFSAALLLCGCEDGGDTNTTVNEAPVYSTGTNGNPYIIVKDNDGLVLVDLKTGETKPYNVVVEGNGPSGVVSISTDVYTPPELEETEP